MLYTLYTIFSITPEAIATSTKWSWAASREMWTICFAVVGVGIIGMLTIFLIKSIEEVFIWIVKKLTGVWTKTNEDEYQEEMLSWYQEKYGTRAGTEAFMRWHIDRAEPEDPSGTKPKADIFIIEK